VLVGRSLDEEERLARLCFVASHFEEIFRAGLFPGNLLLRLAPGGSLEDLLADVPAYAPTDIQRQAQLAGAEKASGWIARLPAAGQCMCAATFGGSDDVGGADADLIAAGNLIDCKATIRPERIEANGIHQLAGYLLLDYEDRYRIGRVSLYLSRQGRLVSWTCPEFLRLLGSAQPLHALRADCRAALASPPPPARLPRQASGTQESLSDAGS
jgi:hypothetical protein